MEKNWNGRDLALIHLAFLFWALRVDNSTLRRSDHSDAVGIAEKPGATRIRDAFFGHCEEQATAGRNQTCECREIPLAGHFDISRRLPVIVFTGENIQLDWFGFPLLVQFNEGTVSSRVGDDLQRVFECLVRLIRLALLDQQTAHLTVAETMIAATPVDRRHRLEVATAALRLSLARKRGHLAGVVDQVEFLASPATGRSDEDIALDSDLRAVAVMNLGTVEAWSLGNQDSQRHLHEGAELARRIGRPYLEVACLAELAFASKIEPFATTRRRCEEAIATAEQHGWGAEPVISPALVNLAGTLIWTVSSTKPNAGWTGPPAPWRPTPGPA